MIGWWDSRLTSILKCYYESDAFSETDMSNFQTVNRSKTLSISLLILVLWQGVTTRSPDVERITISWDSWGVPHIRANEVSELFFPQGWSQMHLHGDLVPELYGRSRGRGAEYWGEESRDYDVLVNTFDFPSIAKEFRESQDSELKAIIKLFVDGMNAYVQANPTAISVRNQVLEIDSSIISATLSFFAVGDHSLLVTRVSSALRRDLSMVIPINLLFHLSSIRVLAEYIDLLVEAGDNPQVSSNQKTSDYNYFDL